MTLSQDEKLFESYTDRARRVVDYAEKAARRYGNEETRTEHILLGLIEESRGVAANALEAFGLELGELRQQIVEGLTTNHGIQVQQIPLSASAKGALQLAAREAERLGRNYVGTEHVLLGLLREGGGGAAHMLAEAGVSLDPARKKVAQILEGYEKSTG